MPMPLAAAAPRSPRDRMLPAAPPGSNYIFVDDFDGRPTAPTRPDSGEIALERESMQDPTFWELPENVGQYPTTGATSMSMASRTPVFHAAKDGKTATAAGVREVARRYRPPGRRADQLDCLTAGCWPAWYLANNSPVNGGEVDIMEWYGNGHWAAGTAVHAKPERRRARQPRDQSVDSSWHTWRVQWDDAGMRFWKDYVDGAQPYFDVPAKSLPTGSSTILGYQLFPVLDLAVAGSGGGDPGPGTYPANMLIDWVRVW